MKRSSRADRSRASQLVKCELATWRRWCGDFHRGFHLLVGGTRIGLARNRDIAHHVKRDVAVQRGQPGGDGLDLVQIDQPGNEDHVGFQLQSRRGKRRRSCRRSAVWPAGVLPMDLLVPRLQADVGAVEVGQREAAAIGVSQVGLGSEHLLGEVSISGSSRASVGSPPMKKTLSMSTVRRRVFHLVHVEEARRPRERTGREHRRRRCGACSCTHRNGTCSRSCATWRNGISGCS